MSLIDRESLYEKACGLEAQALAYVGKIVNDETRTEEWRIWSAVLAERTAFKHDIFDAPEVKPEQRWIPVSEMMPDVRQWVLCQCRAGIMDVLRLTEDGSWNKNYPHAEYMSGFVTAWMPLPEPYKEGE